MEPIPAIARHEATNRDEPLVHDWRVTQLTRLVISGLLAEDAASRVAGLLQHHHVHDVGYFGPGTFEQFPDVDAD